MASSRSVKGPPIKEMKKNYNLPFFVWWGKGEAGYLIDMTGMQKKKRGFFFFWQLEIWTSTYPTSLSVEGTFFLFLFFKRPKIGGKGGHAARKGNMVERRRSDTGWKKDILLTGIVRSPFHITLELERTRRTLHM